MTTYITTPIYYVNDAPHIGHAYTTILADVLSRFHRRLGQEVFFLTGVDEHGQKVKQAAETRGLTPQAHCDDLAPRFINLWERLDIQYDDFVRTTQDRHKRIVQACLTKVNDSGDIYADEYEGWYSVAEERFITETEYASGQFRDVKRLKEKNYFFRMSKYQDALIQYITDHPGFIQPEHRRNEILGFLRQPLADLCISRPKSRMDWGIEIPFDSDYVTYVWFDALINYISIPGYLTDDKRFQSLWPAHVHLIGKDILTTHSVYWTTMLMALKLPLPKTIFAHGWWLMGDAKMSKSLGNVVNPLDLIETYGIDAVRYFLMREMVLGQDANFSSDAFIKTYNSDLANDYGNLLNRVCGLIVKNHDGIIPSFYQARDGEEALIAALSALPKQVADLIEAFKVQDAVITLMNAVRMLNKYIEVQAPWQLVKSDRQAAGHVLYTASEGLRLVTVLLSPIMPHKTMSVLETLGQTSTSTLWGQLVSGIPLKQQPPLFPRIEVDKT